MAFKFVHPSTHLIAGPTGCGKTSFVCKMLKYRMLEPWPERIVWVYSEWQQAYNEAKAVYPNIRFIRGYPENLYQQFRPEVGNLLILDDQMSDAGESRELGKLFTQGSHHRNLSIIYLVQNIFDKGKSHRTASLNSHYFTLFRNLRDQMQIEALARQVFGVKAKAFIAIFRTITANPFSYAVIDMAPKRQQLDPIREEEGEGEEEGQAGSAQSERHVTLNPYADVYSGIFPEEETWMYRP